MESINGAIDRIGIGKFHIFLILILGCSFGVFGFQISTTAILGPSLICFWRLHFIDIYILNSCSYIGMIIGSLIFGRLSDKFGRKTVLIICNIGLIYSVFMMAISPNISWMIFMVFINGCISVGIPIGIFPLIYEWSPTKYGGIFVGFTMLFFSFGNLLLNVLGFLTIPSLGWRSFLIISTIPIIILSLFFIWIPESPRYLMFHKQKLKCLEVMNKVAKLHQSKLIEDLEEISASNSSIRDIGHPKYLSSTIILSFLYLTCSLTFFGINLLTPFLANIPHQCLQNLNEYSILIDHNNNSTDESCCLKLTLKNYKNMLISITAEITFLPIYIISIIFIGRKKIFAIFSLILALGFLFLNFCLTSIQLNIVLFILRGVAVLFFNLTFIYASELFPTSIRSFGLGICSISGRIGSLISPLIVNVVILKYSLLIGTVIFMLCNLVGFIASLILPYETRNRKLYDTADETEETQLLKEK